MSDPATAAGATGVDVPRLRKTLEGITADRAHHDQGSWAYVTTRNDAMPPALLNRLAADPDPACGTACCLAGRTVVDAGYSLVWEYIDAAGGWYAAHVADEDGSAADTIPDVANRLLGLRGDYRLFDTHNTLQDLWVIASDMTGGEIAVPPEFADPAVLHGCGGPAIDPLP